MLSTTNVSEHDIQSVIFRVPRAARITCDIGSLDTKFRNALRSVGENIAVRRDAEDVEERAPIFNCLQEKSIDIVEVRLYKAPWMYCAWSDRLRNTGGKIISIWKWLVSNKISYDYSETSCRCVSCIGPPWANAPKQFTVGGSFAVGYPFRPGIMDVGTFAVDKRPFCGVGAIRRSEGAISRRVGGNSGIVNAVFHQSELPNEEAGLTKGDQDEREGKYGDRIIRRRLPEGFFLLVILVGVTGFVGTYGVVWLWIGRDRESKGDGSHDRAEN